MSNITVKNIPEDLYEQLRRTAAANHRSINSEIIVCIKLAIQNRRIDPEAVLARARQLRELTKGHPITEALLKEFKNEGRP